MSYLDDFARRALLVHNTLPDYDHKERFESNLGMIIVHLTAAPEAEREEYIEEAEDILGAWATKPCCCFVCFPGEPLEAGNEA